MVDAHIQSFFGQNTGIIVKTLSRSKPYIFFHFIKKKNNGIWEKPSSNQGKVIKFSLEEIVMILQVLNRNLLNWTNYHTYRDKKTHISFSWEEDNTDILWINIDDYSKMLNFAQTEILRLLMTHLLTEKIIYATTLKKESIRSDNTLLENQLSYFSNDKSLIHNSSQNETKRKKSSIMSPIEGLIKGESEKAMLIKFDSNKEVWIPKSAIHSRYVLRKNNTQTFVIENWILKKNNLES